MENRPAALRSRRVCRFCLTESEPLSFIYERDHSKPFQLPLTLQIMSCVAIEVYAADGMPQMLCNLCRWNLDRSYKFKLQCKKADEALRTYPLSGVLPRPFPPIPIDPPDTNNKRPAEQRPQTEATKKPRVDNGDRERRETRERDRERERERERERDRDRERDRERETRREPEKQREKSDQRHDFYEEEQDGASEAEQETNNAKEDLKLEPGEIRVHACDQCDRTFPLRQALALHMQRAHRDRNYKCTECDRMFFSKYDLSKHMTTHSEEKPFSCPICQKQFSRANLLQRHEKVHRDELRYACQHCDREFFTSEELEKHEDTVHKKEKPHQCNICNKRFTYKQGLERHEVLHNEDKTFVCEYCKEAFRTSTKLARHLTTHAGHRPYLCKLCPRTFLLSHHLTRHMRTHSVEKRHVCEDCGKAFKRKESLEVHQLTHTKRTGMGLTCDVCQESCRNRADYVTHIKQHIEAGEKMGPDGLQPDNKNKIDLDSDEEEEEEQYSDGDDDYEPPAYIVKKLPKTKPSESDEESERADKDERRSEDRRSEDRKEQVVFVRGKDGNMVKKTIKTLMPIQRRDVQETKASKTSPASAQSNAKATPTKPLEEGQKGRVDETEAQVQKIVASVFKEHKIPLKHQTPGQEQAKEPPTSTSQTRSQIALTASQAVTKEEKQEIASATPKAVNTVKVIKRIVVRKPGTSAEGSTSGATGKDADSSSAQASGTTPHKVTKRVIVRRIIRQGDTTREVIMNPDGTIIDPSELAKLPTGNVVKRVVVKKPIDKTAGIVQAVLQSSTETRQPPAKSSDSVSESPKYELKTSQPTSTASTTPKTTTTSASQKMTLSKGEQETKEKLEQLEKRVEQQRLKIEELQARKQQEYEAIDEMLPERHDESEDEQQLPLKRVFVKRKQSIYDEEQEYNDNDVKVTPSEPKDDGPFIVEEEKDKLPKEVVPVPDIIQKEVTVTTAPTTAPTTTSAPGPQTATPQRRDSSRPTMITSSKVYCNKKIIVVKSEDASEVEEMNRELSSILYSADTVAKIQETVLSNLTQISSIAESTQKPFTEKEDAKAETEVVPVLDEEEAAPEQKYDMDVKLEPSTAMAADVELQEAEVKVVTEPEEQPMEQEETQDAGLTLDSQDLSESTDIFEPSDNVLDVQKVARDSLTDSVMELEHGNDTINLNDTTDSQDSLEDKLSQMEG